MAATRGKARCNSMPPRRKAAPRASRPDIANSDAFRRVTTFCSHLGRSRLSEQQLRCLLAADAAIQGLTHAQYLVERRAAAAALVAQARPRLTSAPHLDRLLEQLARQVDPRFGSLRVPKRRQVATKRRGEGRSTAHLDEILQAITKPRPRWGAIRTTAWLAIRCGALSSPNDPKPRTLETVMPQIYASELAQRRKRDKSVRPKGKRHRGARR